MVPLSENQWGFLPEKSTSGAVASVLYDWEEHLDNGHEIQAVFFDLKKAFDTVPHQRLINKLHDLNLPSHIIALIHSYLYNRHQQVCVNGTTSSTSHVISGVPQGSVLGPLLFLIYVDELARVNLSNGSVVLYADDICLYRPILSHADIPAFQLDVNMLSNKIGNLGLAVNISKCKAMLLSRKKCPTSLHITIGNTSLERVSSYVYLGFLITSSLSWTPHIQSICKRARKQLGLIYRQFYKANANTTTLKSLYITRVRPILEYGASIWDPYLQKDIDCLERVQKFATKMCARNWSLPYEDRLKLLQLPSLMLRRKVAKLCFLYKILSNQATAPFPLTPINHCHFTRSHDLCLRNSHARSNCFLNSFFNSTIRLWNRLPHAIVHADSTNIFKNAVFKFYNVN